MQNILHHRVNLNDRPGSRDRLWLALPRLMNDQRRPLIENPDTQVHLRAMRSASHFPVSVLGGNGDGPYGIQNIKTFFGEKTFPFNSEVGSVGTGDYTSLQRFLPKENLEKFPGDNDNADSVWDYHKYIGYGMRFILSGGDLSFLMAGGKARTEFLRNCKLYALSLQSEVKQPPGGCGI